MTPDQSQIEIGVEVATRKRAGLDFTGFGLMPDPDPVLRKLGRDMRVYRDLLTDAHVFSCAQSRKSGTLSCEWEIRAGGSTKADQQAAGLASEILEGLDGLHDVIAEILDAPFFGLTPVEVIWNRDGSTWFPKALVGRPPEWFGFDDQNRLRFRSVDSPVEGELLAEYKFLLARHYPGYLNPFGERILSRCFWPVSFKRGGWRYWMQFSEKYGIPWAVGKMPRDVSGGDEARKKLLNALITMVQDAVAVISSDESVEIMEAAGKAASGQVFDGLISTANREISKAILGQTLTTELDRGGSYAATKEHMEVRSDLVDADKGMVRAVFNRLCGWITELNVAGAACPEFVFFEEENLQKERAERDEILNRQGVKFTGQYFQRVYNLDEGDFRLTEPGRDQGSASKEPGVEGDGEYAEKKTPEIEGQKKIDALADKILPVAGPFFTRWIDKAQAYLDKAPSMKSASDGLVAGLWEDLEDGEISKHLAGVLAEAARIGVESAGGKADFAGMGTWGEGLPFQDAIDFFKAHAFTTTLTSKADLLGEIKDELVRAMEEGTPIRDFRKEFRRIFTSRGWDGPAGYRIDTIFRTNLQRAYQAGRYKQMTDPDVLKARPFWEYFAVMDASTRQAHADMNRRIYPADHPIWRQWYPPNGFKCRCTVRSLSKREMKRDGLTVETDDPTKGSDPILPDKGWGDLPGTLEDLLSDKQAREELGKVAWKERPAQPGPADLGRPTRKEIPEKKWKIPPGQVVSLEDRIKRGLTESKAIQEIEDEYKVAMGISPKETAGVLKSPDGGLVAVDLNGLAHAMLKRDQQRERYLKYFRDVIENPFEVLLVEFENARGRTKIRKKNVGIYRGEDKGKVVVITSEETPEGWMIWNVLPVDERKLDRHRRGVLAL